jgi:hypothetical protein
VLTEIFKFRFWFQLNPHKSGSHSCKFVGCSLLATNWTWKMQGIIAHEYSCHGKRLNPRNRTHTQVFRVITRNRWWGINSWSVLRGWVLQLWLRWYNTEVAVWVFRIVCYDLHEFCNHTLSRVIKFLLRDFHSYKILQSKCNSCR